MVAENNKESDVFSYQYTTAISSLEQDNRVLKESVIQLEREMEKFKKAPLLVCEVRSIINGNAVIRLQNGNQFLVEISQSCGSLSPGEMVIADQRTLVIVGKLSLTNEFDVEKFVVMEKPLISWADIGGLEDQKRDIREVLELPLQNPDIFIKVGIQPPKGILLYGPSGTGKTMLAKAVAKSTNATFIEIVGSELVQKFIGEGARLVKEIFALARTRAPAIVFIDELDAIAASRIDVGVSGEREVQRTFMQLLAEIDGFNSLDNVKIVGCTNRRDILDAAIIRPGRLDRLIYVPLPKKEERKDILKIHTSSMNLKTVDIEDISYRTEGFSGAELRAVCTEAGYGAIRRNKTIVTHDDFICAVEKIGSDLFEENNGEYQKMFG